MSVVDSWTARSPVASLVMLAARVAGFASNAAWVFGPNWPPGRYRFSRLHVPMATIKRPQNVRCNLSISRKSEGEGGLSVNCLGWALSGRRSGGERRVRQAGRCSEFFMPVVDDGDGTAGVGHDGLAGGAEQQPGESSAAAAADDDQLCGWVPVGVA